ncbi:MAG: RES family NAD+ phosphorylase [Myxococcota bacterium]|nr:RES family NAD+ phosphorylase [Myxococcota bacterium]MDW8362714.1 RES family NAD+ phosphorylase [Myxococcales bacterium]
MSPDIWTRCAARCEPRRLRRVAHRVVESQSVVSTRKLVDTDAEQIVLERLLEAVKPPMPRGPRFDRLHYLLSTPFRYPPLVRGSRFGAPTERGAWYGALRLPTAFAEVAYYRLVFLEGTAARIEPLSVGLTSFRAAIDARRAVDLTAPPFDAFEREISSPVRYTASQLLGRRLREAGIEACLYRSARDPDRGTCIALFEPVFGRPEPWDLQEWWCVATRARVEISPRSVATARSPDAQRHAFDRACFEVDGRLPTPALS